MRTGHDHLYAAPRERVGDFVFDEQVARVFPDMLNRSVPGYATLINMIGVLARRYAQPASRCYDLGCSLGAATLAMAGSVDQPDCRIIGIDNSAAMIEAARRHIGALKTPVPVKLDCADLQETEITGASIVVLNLTLQFIEPARREALVGRIFEGLLPGGILILSEKIAFGSVAEHGCLTDLHHAFKKANGYSELEIAQKRTALEKVLVPETLEVHRARLDAAGFAKVTLWFQCFNFASLVCEKSG